EHAKLDANEIRTGVARVVLQFVVESDGRVDTSVSRCWRVMAQSTLPVCGGYWARCRSVPRC
ncbi:MAG: hypothetical protein ABMA00_17525, partial [Gemmatimonas sp.]